MVKIPPLSTFAGTWTLLNQTTIINGTLSDMINGTGDKPIGRIIYTATGYMSANIMTSNHTQRPPNLRYPSNAASESDADWALVGKHTLAYAGPFYVNETGWEEEGKGQLIHGPLTVANVPSWYVALSSFLELPFSKFAGYGERKGRGSADADRVGTEQQRNYTLLENGTLLHFHLENANNGGTVGDLWWRKVDGNVSP
ncbi:Lipocalin-like domain-containing protein [Bisporella sp. PMI_857]|nr:Lipocalin-like domain-containing protein [Bisporella sp. PMI_857]